MSASTWAAVAARFAAFSALTRSASHGARVAVTDVRGQYDQRFAGAIAPRADRPPNGSLTAWVAAASAHSARATT